MAKDRVTDFGSACSSTCGYCGMCTAAWDADGFDEEQEMPDPIGMAERNGFDAVSDLRDALRRCENVTQALALKQRISALWLAWDALDQEALRTADALLAEASELHHQREVA